METFESDYFFYLDPPDWTDQVSGIKMRSKLDFDTGWLNFDIDETPKYEAAIIVYGKNGISIGDPIPPYFPDYDGVKGLYLDKLLHPWYMSRFWKVFDTIENTPEYNRCFNKYQMEKHGLKRIN